MDMSLIVGGGPIGSDSILNLTIGLDPAVAILFAITGTIMVVAMVVAMVKTDS